MRGRSGAGENPKRRRLGHAVAIVARGQDFLRHRAAALPRTEVRGNFHGVIQVRRRLAAGEADDVVGGFHAPGESAAAVCDARVFVVRVFQQVATSIAIGVGVRAADGRIRQLGQREVQRAPLLPRRSRALGEQDGRGANMKS